MNLLHPHLRRGNKKAFYMKINTLSASRIFLAGLGIALLPALAYGQSTTYPSQPYTWKTVVMKGGGFIDGLSSTPPNPAWRIAAPMSAAPTGGTTRPRSGFLWRTGRPTTA